MRTITILFAILFTLNCYGSLVPNIHEIPGLPGAEIEVRFTNPDCGDHLYLEEVLSNSDELLLQKPKGTYCSGSADFYNSFQWQHSPRTKLIDWINDPTTEEIFFTFQTITDGAVLGAICEAIKERNIKVTFVLSRNRNPKEDGGYDPLIDLTKTPIVETESTMGKYNSVVKKLTSCGLTEENIQPIGILRGHTGKEEWDSIGWAHNKYFLINPNDPNQVRFATGSGNLTSAGVATNHENWLFFNKIPQQSYLAQSVICMMKMQLDDKAHYSRSNYERMNGECLDSIDPSLKKAKGIESFFVPGEGFKAINEKLIPLFSESKKITVGTHLLGYPNLFIRGMSCAASTKPASYCYKKDGAVAGFKNGIGNSEVRLITDDDIHWLMVGQYDENGKVGYNDLWESGLAEQAENAGVNLKFIQTAHHGPFKQLHHSKLILFENGNEDAIWTGAGNLTQPAMHSNFENYYLITIPSVVAAYSEQLEYMWNELATAKKDMPQLDIVPDQEIPTEEPVEE